MTAVEQRNGRKRFPIGIQSFRMLREDDCYYVDKTSLIRQLTDQGKYYFLSRPRRFGKSLFLDTLHELFDCQEELFRGLAIHGHWDWSKKFPVVHLSFGGNYTQPGNLNSNILVQLKHIERRAGLSAPTEFADYGPDRFLDLLERLHEATGQRVVVLIDEYDKPILDVLDNPDLARENRDYLRGFYGIIKDSARCVRFVFVTGVSMFSKVSLFSGLNNLDDISLIPQYATICGYTDRDIDHVFAPELPGLDREQIRHWYNGYNWLGGERVYNPYDVLLLLKYRKFDSHWFQTATPAYLYRLMTEDRVPAMNLENGPIDKDRLTRFDIGDIELRSLMFQSGYLTIADEHSDGAHISYTLEYPNMEVRKHFNSGLLGYMGRDEVRASEDGRVLLEFLGKNDFDGFRERVQAVYASIPYRWYMNNNIDRFEGFYLTVLYAHLDAVSADIRAEESSSHGQSDLVLEHGGQVFLMEAKVVSDESDDRVREVLADAMSQMRGRGYGDRYRGRCDMVHLVAMVFGNNARNLVGLENEIYYSRFGV